MNTEFRMRIGDVTIAIMGKDMGVPDRLLVRYRDYQTEREPDVWIDFFFASRDEACPLLGLPAGSLVQFDASDTTAQDARPRMLAVDSRTLVERIDFAGVLDLANGRGHCACSRGMEFFAVESFLRICFSILAVYHDGLLLHAAGVVHNEKAYVFAGPSGAGKSTIAKLSTGNGRILSDEMVYVQCGPRVSQVFGTPFHGTNDEHPFAPGGPLRAILFPIQHTTIAVAPLGPAEALRRLLAATFSFDASTPGHQRLLDIAVELVQHVPTLELRFRKDAEFWLAIDASDLA